jgi:lipoprotein-anchoring transpeptidase ErfK/SrfK
LAPGPKLKTGSKGVGVLALETRLAELKIEAGKLDGKFDSMTWQGVVAFQKLQGLKRTGVVDNAVREELNEAIEPSGIIPNGGKDHVEVDIGRQVMFVYKSGKLFKVFAISSGSGRKYCETGRTSGQQVCGGARTPRGKFKIQRRIPGWRISDLGKLYNPLYFTGGFAIHGAPSVPASPASHGCVRIPMYVAEFFPSLVKNGTPIFLYD